MATLGSNETLVNQSTQKPAGAAAHPSIQLSVNASPPQDSSSRQPLAQVTTMLKAASHASVLRSIQTILHPIPPVHIPLPPVLLDHVSYILPLGSSFRTAQGQNFAVSVQFTTTGPATAINFTYSGLPLGVSPVTTSVSFAANAVRRIFLNFNVPRSAPIAAAKPFIIHYSAFNGAQKGDIPLQLEIWSGFNMQHQLEDNWCWAAVSTSVDHFYNPSSTVTQCQVVNAQLGRSDCCSNGGSPACNQYGYLDKALTYVKRLDHVDSSTEPYATVVSQATQWHPLGIRVAWSGGGAHFIAATGYEQGQMVVIDDPIYGNSVVAYGALMGTYQGSGNWTHSYFTKP